MKRRIAAVLLALMVVTGSQAVSAEDAVSSATVDITGMPAIQESDEATTLVIYFSADDTVKAVALAAADAIGANVFEVVPEQPYTDEDLAYYTDGRCDKEQADDSARPGIAEWPESLEQYDVIFIGYPIWHGQAPKILYTLLEGIDVSGKTIVPFCTSMSSGAGSSADNLAKTTDDTNIWLQATRMDNQITADQVQEWAVSALEEAAG
ncbi:MAG: flavodoxin [Blautia sp.]|nr:flavodoxin [Blautia sp.]